MEQIPLIRASGYGDTAKIYYNNSVDLLKKNEKSKAGEILSGAVTEMAKALSVIITNGDNSLNTHNERRKFMRFLDEKFPDKKIQKLSKSCDYLHTNFYENFLDDEDFAIRWCDTIQLYDFLGSLLLNPQSIPRL